MIPASQIPTVLFSPGKAVLTPLSHAVEHVPQQMLDVFSAQQLQLEGEMLLVIKSADVWLAGSTFVLCSCSGSADVVTSLGW